jgi:hypothetical protein
VAASPVRTTKRRCNAGSARRTPQGKVDYPTRRGTEERTGTVTARLSWPVAAFFVSLVVPWSIHLGSLAFSVYRFLLVLLILPCLFMWLRGGAGRIRFADIALIMYCIWCALSLAVVHGIDAGVQSGGMIFIETIAPYMLARCYIRTSRDFEQMATIIFRIVAILLPLALYEAIFKHNIARDLFAAVMPSFPDAYEGDRLGLRRVQGLFEHPILFGVFTGSILAMVHLVVGYQRSFFDRWWRSAIVCATAFLSLSAGPLTAVAAQAGLMVWNSALKRVESRWKILWCLVAVMYLVVELASSQSVPAFYISRFAFDQGSAWQRLLIWEFGSASALNHPLFGIGYGEWERPAWLTSSIDMFWLIHAVRYGLPAAFLFLLAFLVTVTKVGFRRDLDERMIQCRTAYLISMTGFFIVGWTVHFWAAAYVSFMFLLGSGVWILDAGLNEEPNAVAVSNVGDCVPVRLGSRRQAASGANSDHQVEQRKVQTVALLSASPRPD